MKLLEYKVMELFNSYGIENPKGFIVEDIDMLKSMTTEIRYPVVIKAQVPVGGRGKAGGIKFAENFKDLKTDIKELLNKKIKGHQVSKLLIVERLEGSRECYLSITLDRLTRSPMLIFCSIGGVDIEETAKLDPSKIQKILIDPQIGIKEYLARYLINRSGLDDTIKDDLFCMIKNIYKLFCEYDCLIAEINPLLIAQDNKIIALDGKVDIDDSALFRHEDILNYRDSIEENRLIKLAREYNFLYIPIEDGGRVSVMSNGSGMIMSCIDLISKKDISVGSALDLGGGATADRVKEGIKIVFSNDDIKTLFINIFGGITRCDEIARGLKEVMDKHFYEKKIIIRLDGTNKEKGKKIINNLGENVILAEGLVDGVEKVYKGREFL